MSRAANRFDVDLACRTSIVADARISHDGQVVAYTVQRPRTLDAPPGFPMPGVWLASVASGESSPVLIKGWPPDFHRDYLPPSWWPRFRPNHQSLGFVALEPFKIPYPQVYYGSITSPAKVITNVERGVMQFEWSPDGTKLACLSPRPWGWTDEDIPGEDWTVGFEKGMNWHLVIVDLQTKENRVIVDDCHVGAVAWSPDGGSVVAMLSSDSRTDEIMVGADPYRIDLDTGARLKLRPGTGKVGGLWAPWRGFDWSPDGKHIAFAAGVDASDPTSGSVFVTPADRCAPRNVTEGLRGTARSVQWLDSKSLLVTATTDCRTSILQIDARSGERREIESSDEVVFEIALAKDKKTFACVADLPHQPPEAWIGELGGSSRRLSFVNPHLDGVEWGEQRVHTWRSTDGTRISGILALPPGFQPGRRYPLVVMPHGGPEGSIENGWLGATGPNNFDVQLFAAQGMVALLPNYRGSSGRGVSYSKANRADMGGQEIIDILKGIDSLVAEGIVDPERVGVCGYSYGGFLAAMMASVYTHRFAAGVMIAGISNWVSFVGTSTLSREFIETTWIKSPWTTPGFAWKRSPVAHAEKCTTPLLIVHGEADHKVPMSQSWELYRALKRAGAEVELVTYPREDHAILEQHHKLDFCRRVVDWLRHRL